MYLRDTTLARTAGFKSANALVGFLLQQAADSFVEAGGKTVIGARCKQSGMIWGEPGAENILALRCIHSSRRLGQVWKARLNIRAACNNALPLAA